MAREVSTWSRVHWNIGFEAARANYRLEPWPCLGKHSPSPKHFNQYSVTVKCVRFGLMLIDWPKGGCTGKRRGTVQCSYMLAEVIRRLQEPNVELTKMVFEEALKIVKSEVILGRSFPTQELDAEFTPAPGPGWKTYPKTKHTVATPGTPKILEFTIKSETTSSTVRKHGNGRDEFGHSVEQA